MPAASPSILFSGCAAVYDRAPVRSAALALSGALHTNLLETPLTICCGARADRGAGKPDARYLLDPLLAAALAGQPVVCLSPACRNALTVQLIELVREQHVTPSELLRYPLHVLDYVEHLSSSGSVAEQLRAQSERPRAVHVALHGICHGDHNPAMWPSGRAVAIEFEQGGMLTFRLKDTEEPDSRLAALVAASGATVLGDVSATSGCVRTVLASDDIDYTDRELQALTCLSAAAQAGAQILITPCALCYGGLKRRQRMLNDRDPARGVQVLHVAQFLGLVCGISPARLGLRRSKAMAMQGLRPHVA